MVEWLCKTKGSWRGQYFFIFWVFIGRGFISRIIIWEFIFGFSFIFRIFCFFLLQDGFQKFQNNIFLNFNVLKKSEYFFFSIFCERFDVYFDWFGMNYMFEFILIIRVRGKYCIDWLFSLYVLFVRLGRSFVFENRERNKLYLLGFFCILFVWQFFF